MGLPYDKPLPGKNPWKPLAQHRAIERAFSALEVAPVRKNYGEPAKDPHLAFETGIPKPAPRTKQPRRIRDLAVVEERPQFHADETVSVNVFVHLPVRQEETPAERGGAFPADHRSRMTPRRRSLAPFHSQ